MILKISILLTIFSLSQNVFGLVFKITGGADAPERRNFFVKCNTTDWICKGTTNKTAGSFFTSRRLLKDDVEYFQFILYINGPTKFCLNIWGGKVFANLYPCSPLNEAKDNELWYRDSLTQYIVSPYYTKNGGSVLWWNGANTNMTIIPKNNCSINGAIPPLVPFSPRCKWILE